MNRRTVAFAVLALIVVLTPLLAACGATPTPTAVPTQPPTTVPPTKAAATTAPPTAVPPTVAPTKPPATATAVLPTPTKGPQVGGTFVYAASVEPDTLDPHKTGMAIADVINNMYGGSLVTKDFDGKTVPYLADSWTISPDGLTYTFIIKKGVKFHNGNPFNATSFAYAYTRAKDPATKATASGTMLGPLVTAVAKDDYTLVLTLKTPNFWFMDSLASGGYLMPLDKAAVDKGGDQYGRSPVGVGPYKFKEWVTGTRIVLERNPDYNWGPKHYHNGGAWYPAAYEFRIVPEYSTQLAGMEVGELDYVAIQTKDLDKLKANPKVQIGNLYQKGMLPGVWYNTAKAPFTDVKVRQAFNYAIDQQQIIKTSYAGNAIEQHGPLSLGVIGYSPDVEQFGQKFDLAKAKQLMKDAGFVSGADGMLSKDGQPFKLTLTTLNIEIYTKNAQILQQQWKALGVDTSIQQVEQGVMIPQMMKGDYSIGMLGVSYTIADLLYVIFHSSQIGAGLNLSQLKDPQLDAILEKSRSETDPTKQQQLENDAQKYIAQNALVGPMCTPMNFIALTSRIKGWKLSNVIGLMLGDVYIQQ